MDNDEIQNAKNKLENKLQEYGSVNLMANLVMMEIHAQSAAFHNPANPMGENPFALYSLGLFLSNNNLDSGEPHYNQITEFVELLTDYFNKFKISCMTSTISGNKPNDGIEFTSKLQKIVDDGNPHMYPHQKDDYYQRVFFPLNDYFISKHGFSITFAKQFTNNLEKRLAEHMYNRHGLAIEKYNEAKKELGKPEYKELLDQYKRNNVNRDQLAGMYAEYMWFTNSTSILLINMGDYCNEQNTEDEDMCKKYLNGFSCSFGEQLEEFDNPLSDNIILHKPIIALTKNVFFLAKPDFLYERLDSLLESLLDQEKQNASNIWNEFIFHKSKYLEDKVYEFFLRVFPQGSIFQNAYYWIGKKRKEVDLIVVFDNKIFLVESKSGNLPLHAKSEGKETLRDRLKDLLEKAYSQGIDAKNYITSQSEVTFWKDPAKKNILLKINSSKTDYAFFIMNITLEPLGFFSTNVQNLAGFNFFSDNKYPWSVYLHDFDVITDLLYEPIYFIHYVEQRIATQNQNLFSAGLELNFLQDYIHHGMFSKGFVIDSKTIDKAFLAPDLIQPIEDYYLLNRKKPRLTIPKKLEKLLLNMQNYGIKGFTDITSLILDFPQDKKRHIAKLIEKKFNKTASTGIPDGFTMLLGKPYDIGFSYYTNNTMINFYKNCKHNSAQRQLEHKITRWATIGRNVLDQKNYATFFIYSDSSAHADESN